MNLSPEIIHELVRHSARISAIVNLLGNSSTRKEMDLSQTDRDMRQALDELRALWEKNFQKESNEASTERP